MARGLLCIILSIFFLANTFRSAAQDNNVHIGVMPGTGISYSGWNVMLPVTISYTIHKIYAGPKINPPKSELLNNTLLGFNAGYQATFLSSERWSSFAGIDYQSHAYLPSLSRTGNKNSLREGYVSLGATYHFDRLKATGISLSFGAGMAFEGFYNAFEERQNTIPHFAQAVRLQFYYNIFRL